MYVSTGGQYYYTQVPSVGEELNYYFLEDNKYIPVYSVVLNEGIRALEDFYYYYDFDFSDELVVPNTVRQIKYNLYQNSRVVKIMLTPTLPIFIATGSIFDLKKTPLLLYVYSSNEIVNEQGNIEFNDLEYQQQTAQKILLSSELLTNSLYSSLYRRLHKEILLSCYEKGIEVIIMSSENIQKNAFKKVLEASSSYSSISVLEQYLTEEIPKSLYLSGEELKNIEDYEVPLEEVPESVLLEPEVFVEELPIEEEALLYGGWEEDMEIEANQTETYIAPDWDGMLTDAHYVMSIDPAVENSRGIIAINPESIPYIPIRQRGEPTVLLVDE